MPIFIHDGENTLKRDSVKLRIITSILVPLWLVLLPAVVYAHDAFTGFEIDNEGQYYGYLGLRTPVTSLRPDLELLAQLYADTIRYSFRSEGRLLDAHANSIAPAVGLRQRFGPWNVTGFAGSQIRSKREDLVNGGTMTTEKVGAFLQGETFYWHERGSFHGIISYSTLDNFLWGRLRGKLLAFKTDGGLPIYGGWDVIGMGNKDFNAFHTGPLLEIPVGKLFFLIKAGYKYTSTFQSGAYTGLELYLPF